MPITGVAVHGVRLSHKQGIPTGALQYIGRALRLNNAEQDGGEHVPSPKRRLDDIALVPSSHTSSPLLGVDRWLTDPGESPL